MRYQSRITADSESGKRAIEKLQAENEALLQDAQNIRSRMQVKVPPSSQSLSMQRDIEMIKQQLVESERDLDRDRLDREQNSQNLREETQKIQQELQTLSVEKQQVEKELES